tara:strand:- start:62 stop:292 length:231 start_codon:yes stop_codon:yes gene_type:complete
VTTKTIQFLKELGEGFQFQYVSDLKIAKKLRIKHSRSGKIQDKESEGHGLPVLAYAFDELGNVTALCHDGKIRQYL